MIWKLSANNGCKFCTSVTPVRRSAHKKELCGRPLASINDRLTLCTQGVKPWVIQSFLTFDSMDRTLKCDHSMESCWALLVFQCYPVYYFWKFVNWILVEGSSHGRRVYVAFRGKTLNSHSAPLHPGVYVVVQFYPWVKLHFLCFGYGNLMIMSLKQRK